MREHLERLSEAAGIDLIHYGTEAEEETIKDTAIAQPLIVAAGIVTGRLALHELDGEELIFAGHSVGEITAAALAGVLSDEDAMRFVRVRANGMAGRQPPPRPAWLQYSEALKKTSAKPSTQQASSQQTPTAAARS